MIAAAVAVGAAIGAPCRYLLDRAVQARHDQRFPWGTLLINLLGSAALGVLLGWSVGSSEPGSWPQLDRSVAVVLAAAGTGWCGTFTTYSTFGYETLQLVRAGLTLWAVGNIVLSVLGGLGMAALGIVIGRMLSG